MATSATERRKQVTVGELSTDFLRIGEGPGQQQIMNDQQIAAGMQAQAAGIAGVPFIPPNLARLSITLAQAKLTKNYGITKMDPYCRVRVGHSVFETHTAHNGGKNPRWNKQIHCHVPPGVDSIYIEIFDERAFTMDDRVAWTHVPVAEQVFHGETQDEWYNLNGKQGDGKEGMINLILSYLPPGQAGPRQQVIYTTSTTTGAMQPIVMMPGTGMPAYYPPVTTMYRPVVPVVPTTYQPMQPCPGGQPPMPPQQMQQQQMQPQQMQQMQPQQMPPQMMQQQPVQRGPLYTEEDVKQVKDMFPSVEEEVIKSVFEANRGNKDGTINSLLSMGS